MSDKNDKISDLKSEVDGALVNIGFDDLIAQKIKLDEQTTQPDFWQDNNKAQEVMKQQSKLDKRLAPWIKLRADIDDLLELNALNDDQLKDDLDNQFNNVRLSFESLKEELKLSGPYDDHDAILSIYAGAGGTDAQDWAQMLLRMYVRWSEKNDYEVNIIDQSEGDEAGLKSVTIEIGGSFAYGKLKGEHGVHRLVRLSPFNSDNLRQTSFARVDVLPKIDSPNELELDEKDIRVDVYRAGGHGGQSVNTTDSAVRVTHISTGIVVAIQNERSQIQNKATAMTILRSRLAQLKLEQHQEKIDQLKGPNQSAEWGNQIRSYVLHPYKQVKDLRTRYETSNIDSVLDGDLDSLITAYLEHNLIA